MDPMGLTRAPRFLAEGRPRKAGIHHWEIEADIHQPAPRFISRQLFVAAAAGLLGFGALAGKAVEIAAEVVPR